jgi:RecB family endonuclease NucS
MLRTASPCSHRSATGFDKLTVLEFITFIGSNVYFSIMAEETLPPWTDRNDALKIFKITGKFGWLHLVVAQEKETQRKFLRLKRYRNWFSIPDNKYLGLVREMLDKGATELQWDTDNNEEIMIEEVKSKSEIKEIIKADSELPDELVCFIQDNPKIIEDIVRFCSRKGDIKYLSDLLEILGENIVSSNERLRVALKEVIQKVSKEDAKGLQELSDLMNQWNLFQIATISSLVKGRLETIQTFEQMIHDEKTYEIDTDKSIHRVLEKSMWLIDENYFLVHSNRSLRTFIGDEMKEKHSEYTKKRFDFAVVDADNRLLILEIKRPSIELTKDEIDQLEMYLRISNQYTAKKYTSVNGYLIGNKISQEAKEIMKFRKGIDLMTYDDLLNACRKRYNDYLKVVEN